MNDPKIPATKPPSKTSTSTFGVSGRRSHDASAFYARFDPPVVSDDDTINPFPAEAEGVHLGDSRDMSQIPDSSVALIVTSPPYFAGKAYETDVTAGHVPADYLSYLEMLHDVFRECRRVLEPGGRICVNVANLGRKPFRSLTKDVWTVLEDIGYLPRGEAVWVKAKGASGSTAFGSWMSPSNPTLRDLTERVLIASKDRFDRAVHWKKRQASGMPWEATITKEEFLEATLDVWNIAPASATRIGHPAPFPEELPARCIQLYTYADDVVLDPFMGSGTTAVAAVKTGRRFVGYDTEPDYVALATARVEDTIRSSAEENQP